MSFCMNTCFKHPGGIYFTLGFLSQATRNSASLAGNVLKWLLPGEIPGKILRTCLSPGKDLPIDSENFKLQSLIDAQLNAAWTTFTAGLGGSASWQVEGTPSNPFGEKSAAQSECRNLFLRKGFLACLPQNRNRLIGELASKVGLFDPMTHSL